MNFLTGQDDFFQTGYQPTTINIHYIYFIYYVLELYLILIDVYFVC